MELAKLFYSFKLYHEPRRKGKYAGKQNLLFEDVEPSNPYLGTILCLRLLIPKYKKLFAGFSQPENFLLVVLSMRIILIYILQSTIMLGLCYRTPLGHQHTLGSSFSPFQSFFFFRFLFTLFDSIEIFPCEK
jgi:hypothetical protein